MLFSNFIEKDLSGENFLESVRAFLLGSRMKVESVKSVPGALLLLNLIHLKAFSNIIRSICLKPVDRPGGWQNQCKIVIFGPFFGVFHSILLTPGAIDRFSI